MDSDNEKKQRAAATTNANVEKLENLNNGCAKQVEGEQAKGAAGEATTAGEAASEVGAGAAAAATEEAAAVKGTTAETAAVEEATAAAVTTDKTSATSSTTAATTDAKQLNNNNNNNCTVKEKGKKVNGLKKAQTAAPVINGLPNGKLQSGEKEQQQQVLEQSVQPVKENESQQSQPAPPINGKTKKNNHRIPVNHISKESSEKELLKPSEAAAEPPPNKKPKLELHNKSDVAANLPEGAAAEAEADLPPPAQPVCNEDELEDTSDEAYLVRHQRALIEERRRFETFLKLSWTNRSRANRRADSRAESSGANTPDPASPAASLHLAGPAGDNESIPSPLAQTMQHPLDAISNEGDVPATTKRQERRRTTSSKLKEHERRSATPDTREVSK